MNPERRSFTDWVNDTVPEGLCRNPKCREPLGFISGSVFQGKPFYTYSNVCYKCGWDKLGAPHPRPLQWPIPSRTRPGVYIDQHGRDVPAPRK
jgi:hypothetical protein